MRIWAVLVCFYPDRGALLRLIAALLSECAGVVVVDNTDANSGSMACPAGCELVRLGANRGIAYAQNVGIRVARERAAQAIVFFDQDSEVQDGLIGSLAKSILEGRALISAPLCVGADALDVLPVVRIGRWGGRRMVRSPSPGDCVDIVISSGTLVTVEVFDRVGLMDEDLFIDYVDTEWCLRCRANGVLIRLAPGASIKHRIGSGQRRLGIGTVQIHNAIRCYYQVRNTFLLLRKAHVPKLFALEEAVVTLLNRAALTCLVRGRRRYLRAWVEGIRDGLKGVGGGADPSSRVAERLSR